MFRCYNLHFLLLFIVCPCSLSLEECNCSFGIYWDWSRISPQILINTHRRSSPLSKMAWHLFILWITYCVRLSTSISNMRTVIEENIYFGSLSIQSAMVLILDPCAERQNIIVQNGVCSRKHCYSTQEKSWGWEAENSVCMETRRTRETIVPRI